MHARMSIFEGPPDKIDEGLRHIREEIHLQFSEHHRPGFKGVIALGDRQSGKLIGISFWEGEETMRAAEEDANRLRSELKEISGTTLVGVERCEVDFFEVES